MPKLMKAMVLVAPLFLGLHGAAHADPDAEDGEKVFARCKACHAVGEGAKHKVGPALNDLFGRVAGTVEGFKFSPAMHEAGEKGLVWNDETLHAYLAAPRSVVPGTKMAFAGLRKPDDIEDVIAYLKTFSENAQ